jgi:hypothetical protein
MKMQNESIPPGNRKTKRKRGGQRGNQNARQHGFYSSTLTPAEICEFWNIANLEGVAPEIAVLRIKLRSALQNNPGNKRVLGEASKLLSRWYRAKYGLDRTDTFYLKMVINKVLEKISENHTVPSPPQLLGLGEKNAEL